MGIKLSLTAKHSNDRSSNNISTSPTATYNNNITITTRTATNTEALKLESAVNIVLKMKT